MGLRQGGIGSGRDGGLPLPGADGAVRQERSSASGLTGDVDGELPPAQNTAFWVVFCDHAVQAASRA
jgi:hypothetical protein